MRGHLRWALSEASGGGAILFISLSAPSAWSSQHVIDKFKVGGKGTRMAGDVAAIVGIESVCAAMGLQPVVLI